MAKNEDFVRSVYEQLRRSGAPKEVEREIMQRVEAMAARANSREFRVMGIDPGMMRMDPSSSIMMYMDESGNVSTAQEEKEKPSSRDLREAKQTIKELTEILERVQKEPLILYRIERISKDKKYAFVKKGETELRIESCKDLKEGDEVMLHPKSMQIVEHLGKPPLEVSRFAPDKIPDVKWDHIGGLEDAKADMIEAIELPHKHKDLFEFYGKKQIKGILLSGPPGCGKTMLGKASANSLAEIYGKENVRTGFLYVKGPEILNQYVGQTEQTIRDMFDDARRHREEYGYPAIIFLDEADAILATRGTRNVGIGNTIVPQFLTEMDGLEESGAIVIIATNRPDVLDPAVVRDGRIDRKIEVTRPSQDNAKYILELNFKGTKLAEGLDAEKICIETAAIIYAEKHGLKDIVNGAMLANCVQLAVSAAIRRDMKDGKRSGVSMEDIHHAVARLNKQSQQVQHDLEQPTVAALVMVAGGKNDEPQEHHHTESKNRKLN